MLSRVRRSVFDLSRGVNYGEFWRHMRQYHCKNKFVKSAALSKMKTLLPAALRKVEEKIPSREGNIKDNSTQNARGEESIRLNKVSINLFNAHTLTPSNINITEASSTSSLFQCVSETLAYRTTERPHMLRYHASIRKILRPLFSSSREILKMAPIKLWTTK